MLVVIVNLGDGELYGVFVVVIDGFDYGLFYFFGCFNKIYKVDWFDMRLYVDGELIVFWLVE